jgi:Protein of unknown function (DUF3460)
MPLFWKAYKSDTSDLIDSLKASKPTLEQEQRAGMALLWNKQVDREAQASFKTAQVKQQAYVYQSGSK